MPESKYEKHNREQIENYGENHKFLMMTAHMYDLAEKEGTLDLCEGFIVSSRSMPN